MPPAQRTTNNSHAGQAIRSSGRATGQVDEASEPKAPSHFLQSLTTGSEEAAQAPAAAELQQPRLPRPRTEGLGLSGLVTLERTDEGILIGPCSRFTWDDIFATRLTVRPGNSAIPPDVSEISGDDLLY